MSVPFTVAVAGALGPIINDAVAPYTMIGTWYRSIGTVYPDVTVHEIHHDDAVITQHPVETGSPVSDHMFFMPQMLEIHCMCSDSTAQTEGYVQQVYQELLDQQQQREPFSIVTGKRNYDSMLMRSLMVKTDGETEFALDVSAVCQQLITATSTTTGSQTQNGQTTPSDGTQAVAQTNPDGTISTWNGGTATFSAYGQGGVVQYAAPTPTGAFTVSQNPGTVGYNALNPSGWGGP